MASSTQLRPEKKTSRRLKTDPEESSREMARYQSLVARAADAFGDEIKASRWLSLPNRDLGGKTPLQAVQGSGYDIHVLEPILTRIEHGVDD